MGKRNTKKAKPEKERQGWLAWVLGSSDNFDGYFAQSRSLALSFVLVAPLLMIYEVALVYSPARATGAGKFLKDLLSGVFAARAWTAFNAVVVVLLLAAVLVLVKRRRLRLNLILPMLLESAVMAAVLVGIAVLFYRRFPHVGVALGHAGSVAFLDVMGSVGAGVYEEIVFRLFLTSALLLAGLKLFGERLVWAAIFAAAASALIFAWCHVAAPGAVSLGHPQGWLNLGFYFTSGVFFAILYIFRGLGVAVYTHVAYDLVVLLGGG